MNVCVAMEEQVNIKKSITNSPKKLYHVTTEKKAKLYKESGYIKSPVRGFDTLLASMAWAIKSGRKIIYEIEPISDVHLLPDHHNQFGKAWWTGDVPKTNIKCIYSGN